MSELVSWELANPLYAFGSLVGFSLGIFYGFDGWRGDTAALAFQDSPRVKNLLWILGPAVAAFFGDIKVLDPAAQKTLLLLAYFLPCLVAGFFVVILWGVVIAVSRIIETIRGIDYGYTPGDALGDYFFYGYRYYRTQAEAARQRQSVRFHAQYTAQIAAVIAATGSATAANQFAVARSILRSIASIIKSYHRDEDNAFGIRANLMLAKPCDDSLRARLRFVGNDRAQIQRCLDLITYDNEDDTTTIVLPIADSLNAALRGAPKAFVHPDGVDVIDDTLNIEHAAAVPAGIQSEINAYFKDHLFRSFGSVKVIGSGTTLGVVNVEARINQLFGKSPDEQRRIAEYLLPFCTALGVVFSPAKQGG